MKIGDAEEVPGGDGSTRTGVVFMRQLGRKTFLRILPTKMAGTAVAESTPRVSGTGLLLSHK